MKRSIVFGLIVAAMSFIACNKVEPENPQNEKDFYYTFTLNNPGTKSILASDENGKFGQWENGDQLGTGINSVKPGYSNVITSSTPVTFSVYYKGGFSGGETIYAYYPYNSATTSITEVQMEIPASQNQDCTSFDFDAMPMASEGFVVPNSSTNDNTPIGDISLYNLGSVIDFQVYSSEGTYASETILNVKFNASKAISGEFSKDITTIQANNESTLAISGFTGTAVTTTINNAPSIGTTRAAAAHIYMVVAPVSGITGSVIVTTNKAVYTFNMATAQSFKRAGLKSFGLNLDGCQNRVAGETNSTTFVFNTTNGIQALGLALPAANNGTSVERVVSDCIVLTGNVGEGSTAPRVWNSNGTYNFRVNKNNTITFSVSQGTIKGISFAAGDNYNLTVTEGTLTGTNWEGSASSVTFTNTDAGRTDINTITVSYTGGVTPVDPVALVMSDIACDDDGENENSLTFSWSAVENASGYQVSTDGGKTYGETQDDLSYTWENLLAGVEYTIYVKAVGDGTNFLTSEAKYQTGMTKEGEVIGVQWVKTAITSLVTGDIVAIVDETTSKAMSNDNGTQEAPSAMPVTISNNTLTGEIATSIRWVVSNSNNTYNFQVAGTDTYLYCTNTNNGVRVGKSDNKGFTFEQGFLKNSNTSRWVGVYNGQDWRCYTNDSGPTSINNIKNTVTSFYKKIGNEPAPTTYSVTIATGIQNGSVTPSKTTGITENESITLTISADNGYELETLTVDGTDVTSSVSNDKYTFSMPAHDVAVSAVFKSSSVTPGDGTTVEIIMSSQTAVNGVITFSQSGLTFTFDKGVGTTSPQWNANSSELRLYAKGTLNVSGGSDKVITSIVYSYVKNANKNGKLPTIESVSGSTNAGSWNADSDTWTDSSGDSSVTMSLGGEAGNFGFKKITVTYK